MGKIDSTGTYIGEILESAVSATRTGLPQWVVRYKVVQKYVESKEELAHFKLEEPAYVDYSTFDYEDVAYFILFGKEGQELANYEQAQRAVGWDGAAFDTLVNAVGKSILVRIEESEYQGKVSLKASWVDSPDAPPTRSLKTLDANELKTLNTKFLSGKKPVVKPAKPVVAAKVSPAPVTGAASTAATAPSTGSSPAPATPSTASKGPKATGSKATKPAPAAATPPTAATPPSVPSTASELPAEVDQLAAWEYVTTHKGGNTDDAVQDAWIAAAGEVAAGRSEDDFTNADWAAIRDRVIAALKLV